MDPVLAAIAPESRLASLQNVQQRLADLMFVELLFEKGPREVAMINEDYNWRKAVLRRQQEANNPADAGVVHGSDDGVGAHHRDSCQDILEV